MKFEFNNNELLKKMLGHYGQIPKGNRSKISGKMMSLGAGVVVSDNVTRAIGIFERARRWDPEEDGSNPLPQLAKSEQEEVTPKVAKNVKTEVISQHSEEGEDE